MSLNPLEHAAGHAEGLRVVLCNMRPQLARDPVLMGVIRGHIANHGGDEARAARRINTYRERAAEAVAAAEVALADLRRIYGKVDPQ